LSWHGNTWLVLTDTRPVYRPPRISKGAGRLGWNYLIELKYSQALTTNGDVYYTRSAMEFLKETMPETFEMAGTQGTFLFLRIPWFALYYLAPARRCLSGRLLGMDKPTHG
jgi:hypothetical protein